MTWHWRNLVLGCQRIWISLWNPFFLKEFILDASFCPVYIPCFKRVVLVSINFWVSLILRYVFVVVIGNMRQISIMKIGIGSTDISGCQTIVLILLRVVLLKVIRHVFQSLVWVGRAPFNIRSVQWFFTRNKSEFFQCVRFTSGNVLDLQFIDDAKPPWAFFLEKLFEAVMSYVGSFAYRLILVFGSM